MNFSKKVWLILFVAWCCNLSAVTLVYNLRIRRVFAIAAIVEKMKSRTLFSAVPIFFSRSRNLVDSATNLNNREKRRAGGSLFNFSYIPSKHWWVEATTGLETDHATFTGTDPFHASRFGLDDFVLSGGYRFFWGKKVQFVPYALVGFPTKWKVSLKDRYTPLVGSRIYNIGGGAELSYSLFSTHKRSLAAVSQVRCIHGFNRSWSPILPAGSKIQPGNVTDLLFALQYRFKRTAFETGYNPSFFTNQAIILPTETRKANTLTRHTGYASITHLKQDGLFGKPLAIGGGFNVSRAGAIDSTSITAWIILGIVF